MVGQLQKDSFFILAGERVGGMEGAKSVPNNRPVSISGRGNSSRNPSSHKCALAYDKKKMDQSTRSLWETQAVAIKRGEGGLKHWKVEEKKEKLVSLSSLTCYHGPDFGAHAPGSDLLLYSNLRGLLHPSVWGKRWNTRTFKNNKEYLGVYFHHTCMVSWKNQITNKNLLHFLLISFKNYRLSQVKYASQPQVKF